MAVPGAGLTWFHPFVSHGSSGCWAEMIFPCVRRFCVVALCLTWLFWVAYGDFALSRCLILHTPWLSGWWADVILVCVLGQDVSALSPFVFMALLG